jgi:hypothetical protein
MFWAVYPFEGSLEGQGWWNGQGVLVVYGRKGMPAVYGR